MICVYATNLFGLKKLVMRSNVLPTARSRTNGWISHHGSDVTGFGTEGI